MRTKDEALHERRRSEIIAAAADCFARKGVHQTTMPEICNAAGISAGALYRYFSGKDAIIHALVEQEREETRIFTEQLTEATDIVAGLTDIMPDLLSTLTDDQYARLTLEIGAEAARNPAIAEAFNRNEAELRDTLADVVRRSQAKGIVDAELDVDAAVFLLIALLDGLAGRSAFAGEIAENRLAAMLVRFVRRLFSSRDSKANA